MHPLLRPRHLTVTVLVFIALGGAGFGIAGVQAADDANAVAIVQDLHVPLPQQGDVVRYVLLDEGTFAEGLAERGIDMFDEEWLDVHWLEDRPLPDGEGDVVLSNRVRYQTGPNEVNGLSADVVAVGTAHVIASERGSGLDDDGSISVQFGRDRLLPCELRNGFQGATWTFTAEAVTTTMRCATSGAVDEGRTWVPVGISDDGRTVILETTSNTYVSESRTEIWIRDGIPYPVRVVEEWRRTTDDQTWTRRTLEMDAFSPGQAPIATHATGVPLPEVSQAPLDGLPDASMIQMVFPLRDAIAAAESEHAPLQDYLQAHPDAFVGYADHWRYHGAFEDGRRTDIEAWTVIWADGADTFPLEIRREQEPPGTFQPFGPAPMFVPTPGDDEVTVTFEEPDGIVPDAFPLPADRPTKLASMADLIAAWHEVSIGYGAYIVDSWGFDLSCSEYGGCRSYVEVGHRHYDSVEVDGERTHDIATVMLAWNGTRIESFRHDTYDSQAPAPAAIAPQQSQVVTVDRHAWVPITAAAAAGITLGALLAAMLYWLSPLLKGGLAGFSRIQRAEVLDHPGRKAIHDAVQAQPGIHHRAIMATTGLGHGTVTHHLRRLLDAGLLSSTVQGRRTCYFVKGSMHHGLQVDLTAVPEGPARDALQAIHATPGIASPALVAQSRVGQSTLHYHLDRLVENGLVEKRRDGRRMTWWPTERGRQVASMVPA